MSNTSISRTKAFQNTATQQYRA